MKALEGKLDENRKETEVLQLFAVALVCLALRLFAKQGDLISAIEKFIPAS